MGRTLADDEIAKPRFAGAATGRELVEGDSVAHPLSGLLDAGPVPAGEETGFANVMGAAEVRDAGEEREFFEM